jgi:hypothetical protein
MLQAIVRLHACQFRIDAMMLQAFVVSIGMAPAGILTVP